MFSNRTAQRQAKVNQLTVISNRLPVSVETDSAADTARLVPSSGGLVSALRPVLQRIGGRWVGWPGAVAERLSPDVVETLEQAETDYELSSVPLLEAEVERFYDHTCGQA